MSGPSVTPVDFVSATAEDYEELMSISGGIYKGTDYLPYRYHAWLKDPRRRMFLAKSEGKIVGFESFLMVDGGETAVVEGLRVAPWMRGQGVAGKIQQFVLDTLHSDHPQVKKVRLTRAEDPPPSMLKKYKVINSKILVSIILSPDQLEEAIRFLEVRLDNLGQLNDFIVLEPSKVLKLFDEAKLTEDLLPGGLLVQGWLPVTTQRLNLEMLFERKITWIYTKAQHMSSSSVSSAGSAGGHQPIHESEVNEGSPSLPHSSTGFLSLGTPLFPVPYADATYRFDIDMFGNNPVNAKIHFVEQLKLCTKSLPPGSSIICIMYIEKSLKTELNQLCEGLTPFLLVKEQMVLEMDI